MNKNLKIESSPISYRFTDEDYSVFNEDDLSKMYCKDKDESKSLWSAYISSGRTNINLMSASELPEELSSFWVDWNDEKNGEIVINQHIKIKNSEEITIFFSSEITVIVPWYIVKKNWTDFFYPSDDNTVIISTDFIIFFCEEKFIVFSRNVFCEHVKRW